MAKCVMCLEEPIDTDIVCPKCDYRIKVTRKSVVSAESIAKGKVWVVLYLSLLLTIIIIYFGGN